MSRIFGGPFRPSQLSCPPPFEPQFCSCPPVNSDSSIISSLFRARYYRHSTRVFIPQRYTTVHFCTRHIRNQTFAVWSVTKPCAWSTLTRVCCLYTSPLGKLIRHQNLNMQQHADDNQIYQYISPITYVNYSN